MAFQHGAPTICAARPQFMQPSQMKPMRRRPQGQHPRADDTRHRLILAAIELGAVYGFSNVPARVIGKVAQSGNISAVNYHFNGKIGLLRVALDLIGRNWREDLPAYAVERGIPAIFEEFFTALEDLKRAGSWGESVVKFVARLAMDEEPEVASMATGFLASRLNTVYDAVARHCPAIPADALRLRVANACLLLLTVSSCLDEKCRDALGVSGLNNTAASIVREAVAMSVRLVRAPVAAAGADSST